MQLDLLAKLMGRFATVQPPAPISPALPANSLDLAEMQARARTLLQAAGAGTLAARVAIRWNPRMRSTAGTAYPTKGLVTLNPRLQAFGAEEVERTLRHELAHLLAYHRAGRRRIAPHGPEWQQACADLGLKEEPRCHQLPLPRRQQARPHVYVCPGCGVVARRVRPMKAGAACSACCRLHNRGRYDARFRFVRQAAES